DEHERGIEAQAFCLHFHRLLVLAKKLFGKDIEDGLDERHPGEDVPGGAEIDAATVLLDRRYHCAIRHPMIANANLLYANIRQRELNGCSHFTAIETQQLVSAAVGAGRVGANAKAQRRGLEGLLLFVDAAP